ncbi:hypothetical protein PoB_007101600 [Plakobranchus ocellatus]|uniref:Secreted protein n=1 Tax=Plakobranchus ocellatus TaxID=259542 RepID=A0AAV4DJZ7_9GAST|nr:hypothetical protein PoB_007101600 [Plakobranchus ocellatus]
MSAKNAAISSCILLVERAGLLKIALAKRMKRKKEERKEHKTDRQRTKILLTLTDNPFRTWQCQRHCNLRCSDTRHKALVDLRPCFLTTSPRKPPNKWKPEFVIFVAELDTNFCNKRWKH